MNAPAASILVVDDEPDLRTLYELTLLREGYRVETASNVQEAREQLKAQRFDAVITDMRLPDGFGMELLQDLRDQQRRERCVVMTAYGSAENAVEALRAGAFDYLTKPVDLKQFRSVVASAIGTWTNTTGTMSLTDGTVAPAASATVTATPSISLAKSFAPDTIIAGQTSTMTITMTNNGGSSRNLSANFATAFPSRGR